MDNFMNRLSQRFSAQEIINANTQAETKELNRLREQRKEYDECMQEMRRLNLKNVESAEKICALAEQVNALAGRALGELDEKEKRESIHAVQLENLQKGLADIGRDVHSMQEETGSLHDDMRDVKEQVYAVQEASQETRSGSDSLQKELEETGRSLAAVQRELASARSDISTLQEISETIHSEQNRMQAREQSAREVSGAALDEIRENLKVIGAAIEEMKEAFAESEELAEEIEDKLKSTNTELQEFMHRESVKVYRNVQAILTDEFQNQTKELTEKIQQDKPGNKGLYALVGAALVVSLGNLGVWIAWVFGCFS